MAMPSNYLVKAAAAIIFATPLVATRSSSDPLPVIDLGYELHRAANFNETGGYYNFSNIRYAAPPVGDLRFRAPQPPAIDRSVVRDGQQESPMCPQSSPPWMGTLDWISDYVRTGNLPNVTAPATIPSNASVATQRDPSQNEDCLFLDVMVPGNVFDDAGEGDGAPVLVWIYGGGYAVGAKTSGYDPRTLLQRSQTNSSEGVVYVALNYRLGAFGFLSGPSFQQDGTANAGLYDQRMALEWVQDNIHLFGGDKNRVTVIGESAGAGSIIHQLTAYAGREKAPFQQAILQSPGWVPFASAYDQENRFQDFLQFANVGSLAEARNLSSDEAMDANDRQIAASPHGSYGWGPAVDGKFVTQDPKLLLSHGQFDQSVRVMVGHNSDEGLLFTPPVTSDSEFREFIRNNIPGTRDSVIDYLAETLYPPTFDGSLGYYDQIGRASLLMGEATFICNALAMDRALKNETYHYLFDVFPGFHSQDTGYTFYNPDAPVMSIPLIAMWERNETVAYAMQDYFTSFAAHGYPESLEDGLATFPIKGENGTLVRLSSSGITEERDLSANERCAWWQLAQVG